MTISSLEQASVGAPVTRGGISVFPIYVAQTRLPPMATGPLAGLIVD